MDYRVLIVGYRFGISEALKRLGIAHGVWNNKPLKTRRDLLITHIQAFPRSREAINTVADTLAAAGPFTHIIAGTESAVYPASVLRRRLGARRSRNSIALRCHDKLLMKEFLRERDIPMLDFMPGDSDAEPSKIFENLGSPVVIKPRQESGGRDLVFADTEAVLCSANKRSKILERYLNAPEFSVESFINNHQIHFQSITQYYVKGHVNIVPALLSPKQQALLLDFNQKVIAAMNIQWGITHLELYLTEKTAFFGEIALRPPGGYLMELIGASYGFNAWDAQVAMELDLVFIFPPQRQAFSAACIFHPGKGVLKNVENWNHAVNLPGVFQSRLKREIGDVLAHRDSVGEDVGYLLLKDADSTSLLDQVDWVQDELRFELDSDEKVK